MVRKKNVYAAPANHECFCTYDLHLEVGKIWKSGNRSNLLWYLLFSWGIFKTEGLCSEVSSEPVANLYVDKVELSGHFDSHAKSVFSKIYYWDYMNFSLP